MTGIENEGNERNKESWEGLQKCPHLPFTLAWLSDSLYIVSVDHDSLEELLYCPLVSISGKSILIAERCANRCISSDKGNSYLNRAYGYGSASLIANGNFLQFVGLWDGTGPLELEYIKEGKIHKSSVGLSEPSSTKNVPVLARNSITGIRGSNFHCIDTATGILCIQLNRLPFFGRKRFFRRAFAEGVKGNAHDLVIDLRNCEGGWSAWATELFKYLVETERQVTTYNGWIRRGQRLEPKKNGPQTISPAGSGRYRGKTYVFTSGLTTSSATFIVIGVQDNDLGTVLGEPCGNNNFRYGDSRKVRLRHTGMSLRYSTTIWKRNSLTETMAEKPIMPDHWIKESIGDYRERRDPLWCSVVSSIRQKTPSE